MKKKIMLSLYLDPPYLVTRHWCQTLRKMFTDRTYKLPFSFTSMAGVCSYLFQVNIHLRKTVLIGISNPHRGFDIHWVRQHLVYFTGLVDIVNTVYETEHFVMGSRQIDLIFNTAIFSAYHFINYHYSYDFIQLMILNSFCQYICIYWYRYKNECDVFVGTPKLSIWSFCISVFIVQNNFSFW